MNLNKAMIIGNLTRDPETRTTASGQTVASFDVATNRVWTNAAGQRQEDVEYHHVVAWAKLAEICSQYLGKGRKVYVEGRLRTREWVGQDGLKRQRTEIIADNMIMLDRAPAGSVVALGRSSTGEAASFSAPADGSVLPVSESIEPAPVAAAEEEVKVEDIPF